MFSPPRRMNGFIQSAFSGLVVGSMLPSGSVLSKKKRLLVVCFEISRLFQNLPLDKDKVGSGNDVAIFRITKGYPNERKTKTKLVIASFVLSFFLF